MYRCLKLLLLHSKIHAKIRRKKIPTNYMCTIKKYCSNYSTQIKARLEYETKIFK